VLPKDTLKTKNTLLSAKPELVFGVLILGVDDLQKLQKSYQMLTEIHLNKIRHPSDALFCL
jgi:hypothetical protein